MSKENYWCIGNLYSSIKGNRQKLLLLWSLLRIKYCCCAQKSHYWNILGQMVAYQFQVLAVLLSVCKVRTVTCLALVVLSFPWRLFSVSPLLLFPCILFQYSSFNSPSGKMFSLFSHQIGCPFVLMYSLRLSFLLVHNFLHCTILFLIFTFLSTTFQPFSIGCSAPFFVIIFCVCISLLIISCIASTAIYNASIIQSDS